MKTGSPYKIYLISDVVASCFGWAFRESNPAIGDLLRRSGTAFKRTPDPMGMPEFELARDDMLVKFQALRLAGESRGIDTSPLTAIELKWRSLWERHPSPADALKHFKDFFAEQDVVEAFALTITRLRDRVQLEVESPEDTLASPEQRLREVEEALVPSRLPRPVPIERLIDAVNRAMVHAGTLAVASHQMHTRFPNGPPPAWCHHSGQHWEQITAMGQRAHAPWLAAMDAAVAAAPAAWLSLREHHADLPAGWTSEMDRMLGDGRVGLAQKAFADPLAPEAADWSDLHDSLLKLLRTLMTISLQEPPERTVHPPASIQPPIAAVIGPVIDTDDLLLLKKLAERPQVALTLIELADAVKRARKTVGLRVEELLKSNFVARPSGRQMRVVITTGGLRLVRPDDSGMTR